MGVAAMMQHQKQKNGLQIVPCCSTSQSNQDQQNIEDMVSRLLAEEPAFSSSWSFGARVGQGQTNFPSLFIGDQREIELFNDVAPSQLDYRMGTLAQADDAVFVNTHNPRFETYLRDYLKLTDTDFIEVGASSQSIGVPVVTQCRKDPSLLSKVESIALKFGGLNLIAYLTTGNVWRLGQQLSENTHLPISICGPRPRISRRVNDKLWFTNVVHELLGADSAPPSYSAYGPSAAAALVKRLCKTADRVVVKVPDSAGSAGNFSFVATDIEHSSLGTIKKHLLDLMHANGWRDHYPLQVGVWESDVTSSPSAQIWIPLIKDGLPLIEGIFEQIVEGTEGKFIGARPAKLTGDIRSRFINEALMLATTFQHLGYLGRCSMDAIIAPSAEGSEQLHWIECNGRWGGVSIPMTLANDLCGGQRPKGMVIVQQSALGLNGVSTQKFLEVLRDKLFHRGQSEAGIVLMSPCERVDGSQLTCLCIGQSQPEAEALARSAMDLVS